MMYFAIRVAVASSILIAFYVTRGFGSTLEVFVMAFAASLAAQGVAFGVKMLVGERERSPRAVLLLAGCVVAVAASVVFVAIDKQMIDRATAVRGLLDLSTLKRRGDTCELTIVDGDRRIPIRYRGELSDQVRERTEIVARGQWQGDVFVATELSAKCPTTYGTPAGPKPAAQFR